MEKFKDIFKNHKLSHKTSTTIYQQLKPIFKKNIENIIYGRKNQNKGPKIKVDLDQYLDAIFEYIDNGGKRCYLLTHYNITATSFDRYLNIIANYKVFQSEFDKLQKEFLIDEEDLMADSTTCISNTGKESTNWSYKVKGKRTVKIGLLASTSKRIVALAVSPGNVDDRKNFHKMSQSIILSKPVKVFVDSGYTGKTFRQESLESNYDIVAVPKVLRNGNKSHQVEITDVRSLRSKRPRIEHINSQLKRFRGIATKYVRKIQIYESFIYLVSLIISIHNGILRPNNYKRPVLKLKFKTIH